MGNGKRGVRQLLEAATNGTYRPACCANIHYLLSSQILSARYYFGDQETHIPAMMKVVSTKYRESVPADCVPTLGISPPLGQADTARDVVARLRDNNFDLLRLVFASMVVVFHIGILSQAPLLAWMHRYASAEFAVQAFFVVSGFLVTMSFENSSSLRSYASKRLRRIVPAYVFVVVGAAVILSLLSSLSLQQYFTDLGFRRYLGYNLLLSNFSAPSLPGLFQSNTESAVNGSLWTIKIEVAFYCFVPIMVWAVRRYDYRSTLLMLFVLSLIWKGGFNALALMQGNEFYAKLARQLPGQMAFFVGGAWAYYRTRDGGAGVSLLFFVAGVLGYVITDGMMYDFVAPIAVTMVVYWAAITAPPLGRFGKYGDFSYGVYLYHFPMVQTCVSLGLFALAPVEAAVGLFVFVGGLAIFSWYVIESPFLHHRVAKLKV